jgi:hypothetical protein
VVLAIPDGADIAKTMLREHAKRIPTGEIVREINPMVVPQIDPKKFDPDSMNLRAYYRAAKGF